MKTENIQVAFDSFTVCCTECDVWGRGKADKY